MAKRARPRSPSKRSVRLGVDQVGPDQTGFMRFYASEILPKIRAL
jgi:hypothetical protein